MIIKVLDILHSDNGKANYRESKVGEKYEYRKNKMYMVDFDNLIPLWGGLEMLEVKQGTVIGGEKDVNMFLPTGEGVWTTEYKGRREVDGKLEIYTRNSIYVCEIIE